MKMKTIKNLLMTIFIILFLFVGVSYSATTENNKCKAPDYFAKNYHDKYNCAYNKFLADIEEGFRALPFPDTREKSQLFLDVIYVNFFYHYDNLPMFYYYEASIYETTEKGSNVKSVRILMEIETYSTKRSRPVTLRLWWDLTTLPKEQTPRPRQPELIVPKKSFEQKSNKAGAY